VDAVTNIGDVALQQRVPDPVLEQVESPHNRQTGADQSHELLVEHDEVFRLDRLLPLAGPQRNRPAAGPDRHGQEALLLKPVLDLVHILANEYRLHDLARWLGVFAIEFHWIFWGANAGALPPTARSLH